MKVFIGLLLVVIGLFAGLYFGLWWAFIGGIVDIIHNVQAPHIDGLSIAIDIAKIVLASAIGTISATVFIIPGSALLK